jgi:hypothetical protein
MDRLELCRRVKQRVEEIIMSGEDDRLLLDIFRIVNPGEDYYELRGQYYPEAKYDED